MINERVRTIVHELQQQIETTSFQLVTRTVSKGQGNYANHMYPSRKQKQNYKNNLQKLKSFANRTRSQAMVPAQTPPPKMTPKQ